MLWYSKKTARMSCCCISCCGSNYQPRVVPKAKSLLVLSLLQSAHPQPIACVFVKFYRLASGPLTIHTSFCLSERGNLRMFLQVSSDLPLTHAFLYFQLYYFITGSLVFSIKGLMKPSLYNLVSDVVLIGLLSYLPP